MDIENYTYIRSIFKKNGEKLKFKMGQSISDDKYKAIIFLGIVIRGETSHYDLVTQEVFRSIGVLSNNHPDIAIINNVICVENMEQLEARLVKNTTNNANALIELVNEKSS